VFDPPEFVAASDILYVPAARNVKVGFCDVEVEGVAPVHVQLQLVGVFDDISEHKIDCPVQMAGR